MNALAQINSVTVTLPALVDRAAQALAGARTSAEVLEARDMASVAYDAAKKAARFAKAKGAHDTLIAATHRAQADALEIEAGAKRRLADEYDAAQPKEVQRGGRPKTVSDQNGFTAASVGVTRNEIYEARTVRDAEEADPGIVRRTLDDAITAGEEPTKARVRRAVLNVVGSPPRPAAGREAICSRVREAIVVLAGLPPATEVARYFAGTDGAMIISERLKHAVEWIEEFNTAWGGISHARQD